MGTSTYEIDKLSKISWRWPIGDCLNLGGVNFNPFGRNHISQKHKLVSAKGAFLEVGKKQSITKGRQNLFHIVDMFMQRFSINKDVIKVNNHELANEGAQDVIHKTHKSGRIIGKAKGHLIGIKPMIL